MKKNILTVITIFTFGAALFGCKAEFTTNAVTTNTAKPGAANTNTTANSNGSKSNSTSSAKKDGTAKPALKDEKKPAGEAKTTSKKVPVPENWIYVYDEGKGYGFSVPEGSTGGSDTVDGVDTFVGSTPAPSEAAIFVIAFKDREMTKDDLLDVAVKFLEEMGETVKPGNLSGESEDYAVAEATSTTQGGDKSKWKILVGTDITDNYVMLVGTEESKFEAHRDVIDAIWGSFEMWSGGASGAN